MENYVGTAAAAQDERTRADQAQMAQDDELDRLAQTIKAAATTGGSTARTGIVMVDPLDGWTQIDLGGGELVQAKVSGSFRSTVKAGQEVRIAAQGGGVWYIGAILTPLDAPTVTAPPSNASSVSGSGATYSWTPTYYYKGNTTSFAEVNTELGQIETALNSVIAAVNSLITAHNTTANAISGVVTGVNNVVTKVNSINSTTAGIRSALLDQGHIA